MHGPLVQPVQRRDRAIACYDQRGSDETEDRHGRRRKSPTADCPRRRGGDDTREAVRMTGSEKLICCVSLMGGVTDQPMSKIVDAVEAW
jgi:hypothetical protein